MSARSLSKSTSDAFLPPDPGQALAQPPPVASYPGINLRGSVLRFEPEDRGRFCRALGVLKAGAVRELLPSPVG